MPVLITGSSHWGLSLSCGARPHSDPRVAIRTIIIIITAMKIPQNAQLHFADQWPAAFWSDRGVAGVQQSGTPVRALFGCSYPIRVILHPNS